ncbi:Cruciform DNA binding protein [Lithohypha guttulata]|uniref:Cruciform DNA binding protein n=1 Tax=Lithohypha guttulata TaxID=1690604 RepID=A0AAN7Y3W3_9EURO|nr:Cruciform DNA binding protein [Lithohypha guttulata]
MGTFLFRWPYPADHVYVTGTFDDWGKTEKLNKVGDVFEREVELPSADEKIYYKFVVDDQWIVDEQAPKEDDGHYNVNNVLLPDQIKKKSQPSSGGAATSGSVAQAQNAPRGSGHRVLGISNAPPGSNSGQGALTEAPTVSAGGEGAPLLTAEQSRANLARWIPHVTADPNRPVTRAISQNDGAAASKDEDHEFEEKKDDIPGAFPQTPAYESSSFSVAPIAATGHSNTQSSVTTLKEYYDNAGGEGTADSTMSTQPVLEPGTKGLDSSATTSKEDYDKVGADESNDEQVSVSPLPATGHKDIQSSVTTSKEDYGRVGSDTQSEQQVSINPLPATGHSNTQSSVTTSKEDYEKAGAFGAAGAAVAGIGAAIGGAFSRPKPDDKNIIPESSLPMNPDKSDTMDTGPFMNSAGPGTTTADLASKVPLEPRREAQVVDSPDPEAPEALKQSAATPFVSSSGPGTTTADLASRAPLEPRREAHVVDDPASTQSTSAPPFTNSSGPGTTTAALASQVPLEQKRQGVIVDDPASPELIAEKSAVEQELLSTIPKTQATGASASAARMQTSFYGLATAVPEPVGESIAKAHASPEAATEPSVVAEKSAFERELQAKVPVVNATGEPAPTISAATSTSAPEPTSTSGPGSYKFAAAVPETVEESFTRSHTSPEAATESSAVAEKSAVERELQEKVPLATSTGEPAPTTSSGTGFSSYRLATAVPETVEDSITKAHVSPEAATETSAVAEKSAVERELQEKVPVVDSTGEPAPGHSQDTAAATVASLTDGRTANEPVPDTDTGNQDRGGTAGAIAGGAVVGGAAAASAATLSARHNDRDIEPPRIADSQKPNITSEVSPADSTTTAPDPTLPPTSGIGAASPHPGVSPVAGAALSDGTEDPTIDGAPPVVRPKAPVETSEATATEYAPPRKAGFAPGVSPSAAAALSDGTEDPTLQDEEDALQDEPAVRMMAQNEATDAATTIEGDTKVYNAITTDAQPLVGSTETTVPLASTTAPILSSGGPIVEGETKAHNITTIEPESTQQPTLSSSEKPTERAAEKMAETAAPVANTTESKSSATPLTSTTATTPSSSQAVSKPVEAKSSTPETPKKTTAAPTSSAASTPARGTPESSTAGDKKKKRNRLSQIFKKIFD